MSAAAAETPALSVRGLCKRFGSQRVLDEVELEVGRGELLVVLGPSGSGKTTLLRILAGLTAPDAGAVAIDGRDASGVPPQDRRFGVVLQDPALFPLLTVEENVAFGLHVRGAPPGRVRERVEAMLALTGLRAHRGKYPGELSGGQRQRVALARALAFQPRGMLLDEPFTALDPATRVELRREVRRIQRDLGIPVVFVTHDQEEALELADRILLLNGGRVEQIGPPFEIYNRPASEFVATFIGAANVLLGRWTGDGVEVAGTRLEAPSELPPLEDGQPVKVVFRPEDAVLAFEPSFLGTSINLGPAVVESVSYVGPSERMVVRATLVNVPVEAGVTGIGAVVAVLGGFPLTVTRTKWEARDMELSPGDPVVIGLKDYRLLPHFPLRSEGGASVLG